MKLLFICKASTTTGLGHLIRSRSFVSELLKERPGLEVDFYIIGEPLVERLLTEIKFAYTIVENEDQIPLQANYDICFFDLIPIDPNFFQKVKSRTALTVSLSPIFDKLLEVDLIFNRTKYHQQLTEFLPGQFYGGLEHSIIQSNCKKINTSVYEENLELDQFPIALIMGGGDAANKTLQFLKSLKNCTVPATFWVLLGEGYSHSYNELIEVIKKDSKHEIILAKTNRSMWQILRNCILAILPGGITTYEAAYAGLPTINMLEEDDKYYLIQELEEYEVCFYNGVINEENLDRLNRLIESLYQNKKLLLQMHINSKGLISANSPIKILEICEHKIESFKIS